MPTYPPALADALATIDEAPFICRADGNLVAQSSSQHIIAHLINRLDFQPGMTVLEIGIGSGYSTALLAHLVGSEGHVVSVGVVAELVDCARTLLPAHGYANTTIAASSPGPQPRICPPTIPSPSADTATLRVLPVASPRWFRGHVRPHVAHVLETEDGPLRVVDIDDRVFLVAPAPCRAFLFGSALSSSFSANCEVCPECRLIAECIHGWAWSWCQR